MQLKFTLLFSMLIFTTALTAQLSPVNWSYDAQALDGQEYELTFTAQIDAGWYVYSQFLDEGGPIPTSFTFEGEGLELVGSAKETGDHRKEGYDDIFEMQLIKFGKKVQFTQKVKVIDKADIAKGYLTFMTCNNESCLPPKDVDFEIVLK